MAKEAQARLKEEEAKVVMIDGRKAKVKRRRRLRKVVKESKSDDRGEEELMSKEEADRKEKRCGDQSEEAEEGEKGKWRQQTGDRGGN